MKKCSIILAGFMLMIAACNNRSDNGTDAASIMKDSTKYTSIQWQDSAIDFGTKKMGDMIDVTFKCTNTGSKPLYLFEVRPGCGCTLVNYTKTPIAPGKQGLIEAKLDSKKSHVGNVRKTVYVSSNTSNTHIPYLSFSGTIAPAASATKK